MTGELLQWLAGFPPAPTTFIIAMLPVIELRGALPIAFTTFDLPLAEAILYAVLGNLIIVPPLYLFLHVFSRALRRWSPRFDKVFVWYIERTRTKIHSKYERWGLLALIIFVATPLPGTGCVWRLVSLPH
jgi:uncharacterized membrane protein